MAPATLADQLLDAQVSYVLAQLSGDALQEAITRDVDALLAVAVELRIGEVIDAAEVKRVARRLLQTIPASVAATEVVHAAADVLYAGPAEPFAVSELVAREDVETLLDEALGMSDLVEHALEQLTRSPLVGTVASRFVARIVSDVLQANRAVAEKIPGVGSLMSFGTSAASRVMGAADKQFEQLVGDTAGKGATYAVRRLNKIFVETMRDPTTREALLQVWDLYSAQPVGGLQQYAEKDDVYRLVGVLQGMVATGAATEQAAELVDSVVDAFFERYADYPVTTLLDELEISRDDLVADLQVLAPRILDAASSNGALERLVRARLEPFFASPEVAALLV